MDNSYKKIQEIKEKGYTILPQVLEPNQVEFLLFHTKKLYEETKDKISQDAPYLNKTSPNIYNLQNHIGGMLYLEFLLRYEPKIEEILKYFLNDKFYKKIPQHSPNYILRHYGARSSTDALPLHIDSFIPYTGDEPIAMQVAIMLEDSNIETGCTTMIPGSHQSGKYADQKDIDKTIPIETKAGDYIIWDSRVIHGTTENKSGGTRWALVSTFTRWWIKQMFDIPKGLNDEIYNKLSQKEKYILGFGTIPYENEYKGIDLKKGYENI